MLPTKAVRIKIYFRNAQHTNTYPEVIYSYQNYRFIFLLGANVEIYVLIEIHSTEYTVHNIQYIVQTTIYNTQYEVHSREYIAHSTPYIVHCTE